MKYTRAILDAIHSGELATVEYETYETFSLHVPTSCTGVPSELLNPKRSWNGKADFKEEVIKLGVLFAKNFDKYADEATPEVIKAGKPDLKLEETRTELLMRGLLTVVGPDVSAKVPSPDTPKNLASPGASVQETGSDTCTKEIISDLKIKETNPDVYPKETRSNVSTESSGPNGSTNETGPDLPLNSTRPDVSTKDTSPNVSAKEIGVEMSAKETSLDDIAEATGPSVPAEEPWETPGAINAGESQPKS